MTDASRDHTPARAAGFDEHLVKPEPVRAAKLLSLPAEPRRANGAVPPSP